MSQRFIYKLRQRRRLGFLRRTYNIAELFEAKSPLWYQVAGPSRPEPTPWIWRGNGDRARYRRYTRQVAPLRLISVPGARVFAYGLVADQKDCILHRTEFFADEVLDIANPVNHSSGAYTVGPGASNITLRQDIRCRDITDPALVVAQCGVSVYGHWILDILPKVALSTLFPVHVNIVLPGPLRPWQRELLEVLGISQDRILTYDPAREQLRLGRAVFVSHLRTVYALNPLANVAYNAVRAGADVGATSSAGSTPIYVSRRSVQGGDQRLVNRGAVEALAQEHGVKIVEPERLSIRDQVRTFAAASLVIGEQGSGLHNTAFSAPGTPVLCLHSVAAQYFAQAGLGAVRGQPTGFIFGKYLADEDPHGTRRVFEIGLADLRAALNQLFF